MKNFRLWTTNQALTFDDVSPAKGVEGKVSLNLNELGYSRVAIQATIKFDTTVDGNPELRVRNSIDNGTTKDTILLWSQEVAFTTNTTKIVSCVLSDIPYLEFGIYNGTTAACDITISAKYAGLKC